MVSFVRRHITKELSNIVGGCEEKFLRFVNPTNVHLRNWRGHEFNCSVQELSNNGLILPKVTKKSLHSAARLIADKINLSSPVCSLHVGVQGTINFGIDKYPLAKNVLDEILTNGLDFAFSGDLAPGVKKKVIVEYSSPNIAKPFHAGHLRSTVIGNFIANLSEAYGHDVTRINLMGDWGLHFGLLLLGFDKYGDEGELARDPIKHLFKVYVLINTDLEVDEQIKVEALNIYNRLEQGDETLFEMWRKFREMTITDIQKTYKKLGVYFDEYSGESVYSKKCYDVVEMLKLKKIAQISDKGTLVVDVSADNDMSAYATVTRSDGSSLYITKDLAAAIDRAERFHFDKMYYVVDKSQSFHFETMFKTLKKMGYDWVDRLEHVKFGKVRNMSTRRGHVVFLEDILDEAKTRMLENMAASKTSKVVDDVEKTAEKLGVAAVMVQDMKHKLLSDYSMDWEKMLQSQGDTGVFLQYTHARLCSLEGRAGIAMDLDWDASHLTEASSQHLVQHLMCFEHAVRVAHETNEPVKIVKYLFHLGHFVGAALNNLQVIGSPSDVAKSRMVMFHCARTVLAAGMKLLSITPLTKM